METINSLELRVENLYPDEQLLRSVLGKAYDSYVLLLELFRRHDLVFEWRYYRDGKAWLCKVQKKKRTIVWMSAWKGFMQATIYFPQKYVEKVYELDISAEVKNTILATKNTGKSKPCIFKIQNPDILGDFEKVMCFKIDNT